MSNYYYNDQSGCNSCLEKNDYSELKNISNYSCDLPCLCRFNVDERSDKDKMYYDWFVLNKPVNIPKNDNKIVNTPTFKMCNNR